MSQDNWAVIKDAFTLLGSILGILLTLGKVWGKFRKKLVSVEGKRWGDQYYAYFIFNEPIALTSFTLDMFAGENLLRKVFDELKGQRLLLKARDQILVTIDLEDPDKGSVEVELFYGEKRIQLGSMSATHGILETSMVYEYLNKEVQINIGYLFKDPLGKLRYRLSKICRRFDP